MKIRASRIFGKRVLLDVGILIGQLTDLKFDKRTGEVYALIVKPEDLPKELRELFRWEGENIIIPATTLKNIGDFIIIDKNKLAVYKL